MGWKDWFEKAGFAVPDTRILLTVLAVWVGVILVGGILLLSTVRPMERGVLPGQVETEQQTPSPSMTAPAGAIAQTPSPQLLPGWSGDQTSTALAGGEGNEPIPPSGNGTVTPTRPQITVIPSLTRQPSATWFIRTSAPYVYPTIPSRTPTRTRTRTPTPTRTPGAPTRTRTITLTRTITQTPTRTLTRTATLTQTQTLTRTVTLTPTETLTPTVTPTITMTPTATLASTRIGFSADVNDDDVMDLLVAGWDGTNLRRVFTGDRDAVMSDWTPGGARMLFEFVQGSSGERRLFTILPDGTRRTLLPNQPAGNNSQGAYSPDGNWVALVNENAGQTDLYVVHRSSDFAFRLTNTEAVEAAPSWSPDGDNLLFAMNGDLYFIDTRWLERRRPVMPEDLAPRALTNPTEAAESEPEISPDGERLLFARGGDLWVVDLPDPLAPPVDLSAAENLTDSSGSTESSPDWSPDGRLIAFLSNVSGQNEIYWMRANGSDATLLQIPEAAGEKQRPNWK